MWSENTKSVLIIIHGLMVKTSHLTYLGMEKETTKLFLMEGQLTKDNGQPEM